MRRFLRILAVVLVLCLVPVAALAEQNDSPQIRHEQLPFQVNPLYEGLISEADLVPAVEPAPEEEGSLSHTQPTFNAAKATYVSPETAATQLRKLMKSRAETVELYVKCSGSHYETVMEEILLAAVEHTGDPTEGDYLLWQFAGWGGEVYTDRDGANDLYHYKLQLSYYTTAQQEKELDSAVKSLLSSLNLSGKSDYQKVCAVYDYICANVTYDYDNLNNPDYWLQYTAYAALMNKTSVCQGYATLLYRLLLELGIDNRIITGETADGGHAWNIVKLGDVYYNVDATWDSILGDHDYFLRNNDGFIDHARYLDYSTYQFNMEYPTSATDYVDGVAGEPEYIFVWGMCGENAFWAIDRDLTLTIFGEGPMEGFNRDEVPWPLFGAPIKRVVVEEGITEIGSYAFYQMTDLTTVSLPDSLEEIGGNAFDGCVNLTEITIPNKVSGIRSMTFQNCTGLKSVKLGASVQTIDSYAFSGCVSLEQINFPDSLRSIGAAAFDYCRSLKELTIPATVESLSGFRYCNGLETIHIHAQHVVNYGMSNCENLKNVYLYDTVESIGNVAFEGCNNIETITVPASVKSFGMADCYGLKTIYFLGDAPEFSYYAFSGTTATAYYPADNPTWTDGVRQNYTGNITWVPYTPGEAAGLLGDVNGDDIIDSYDATLILQYDVGMIDGSGLVTGNMDVSGDGIIDSYDATLILQYDVGMIPAFPAEG